MTNGHKARFRATYYTKEVRDSRFIRIRCAKKYSKLNLKVHRSRKSMSMTVNGRNPTFVHDLRIGIGLENIK